VGYGYILNAFLGILLTSIGLDVNLLQLQIHCCESECTAHNQDTFQIKVVYRVQILLGNEPLMSNLMQFYFAICRPT